VEGEVRQITSVVLTTFLKMTTVSRDRPTSGQVVVELWGQVEEGWYTCSRVRETVVETTVYEVSVSVFCF